MGRITIGGHTSIEDNCVIHSGTPLAPSGDVRIGEQVIVGHGAVIHARSIGSHVLIGINAMVLHDAEIGDHCVIGAGCVVGQGMKVPDDSLVLGVPGKIKGRPTPQQLWWTREGCKEYLALMKAYREEGL
jgi:carbonic anhydrase/acetyltransferase-like protein (isoleucine patch superfamily)